MGWKGTVRSIGAAVRAAERDAKRRQRELEKRQKQYDKMQELEQASYEVEVYENGIEVIQSMHKDCSDHIDWLSIAKLPQPQTPVKKSINEEKARVKLNSYKPGFVDKLFKWESKKTVNLNNRIDDSIKKDEVEYRKSTQIYETTLKNWEESTDFARRLIAGDRAAKIESIKVLNIFSEISSLGSSVEVSADFQGKVEAVINVYSNDIVPPEVKSLLKSGKLSIKKMPKGMFNEIYQDYVCSCVLRVGNELFAAIPDELVTVTAVDFLLNSKTGHLEKQPILSACISRSTIKTLNMDMIDPSDSMSNFVHNMSFKKASGFSAILRVDVAK
ncbi:MAG: hypothetical protein ACKVJE_12890 [Pseudomonadales bacterium]|jgi:hypothetical protein